ncbi:hypothetical protein cypCar_00027078 [Cyprinus carpio]|nr:hypothetical protein cypCar_00027078 [Cyprinus carpio]
MCDCVITEASELSSMKPQLDELRIILYAVVKEDTGTEIQNIKKLFTGEIFVDVQVQMPQMLIPLSSSALEGETLAMGMWSLGLGGVGAAIAGLILANTDFLLTEPAPATLEYLGNADLKTINSDKRTLKGKTLWEKSGAVVMAVRRPG